MKIRIIYGMVALVLIISSSIPASAIYQQFDKSLFYKVLKQGTLKEIDEELALLENASFSDRDAYLGTLQMKKSGMVKKNKEKIDLFKSGRIKLETIISANRNNTEYRFLRLIIQEHVPKQTKYQSQQKEDSDFIRKNFSNLPANVQEIVKDYSLSSTNLKSTDF